jgi:hypothetical protein
MSVCTVLIFRLNLKKKTVSDIMMVMLISNHFRNLLKDQRSRARTCVPPLEINYVFICMDENVHTAFLRHAGRSYFIFYKIQFIL